MRLSVRSNVAAFKRDLRETRRKIRFATAMALTWTAQDVRQAERAEMERVFDRPTPYVLNAFQVRPATADRLVSSVQSKYASGSRDPGRMLRPHVEGGGRLEKRSEALLAARLGLPAGSTWFIPDVGARLDRYGNMSRPQLVQVMSDLGAQMDRAQNASDRSRKRNARARHFALRDRDGTPVAIVIRQGGVLWTVLAIVHARPQYRARLDWYGIAERTARARFPVNLRSAIARTVAPRGSYSPVRR